MSESKKPKLDSNGKEEDLLEERISKFLNTVGKQLAWALGSIILALLVAALVMIAVGFDPILAYGTMLQGAMLNPLGIFFKATPLIITGLSVAIAFKAGLFNIGAEGQLYMGAICAAIIGFVTPLIAIPFIHPLLCLGTAALAGAAWGIVPGILKAYRGAHEVVTTMMLSFVAILLTGWLSAGPLRDPFPIQAIAQTVLIYDAARLPNLFHPELHLGFILAIILVIVINYLLQKTILGYEMRAVGINAKAAEAGGINPKKITVMAMGISGALAGLAGASEVQGTHYRFIAGFSPGYGFDGITVAVLGANNPIGALIGAIFFGFLRAGEQNMQVIAKVPIDMVNLIQGLIILFIAAPMIIDWLAKRGVAQASWIKKEPIQGFSFFTSIILAAIGTFIGFGTGFLTMSIHMMIGLGFVILGGLSLFAFITILGMKRWAPLLFLIVSIGWIPVGIAYTLMVAGNLLIPLLVIGFLGIALGAYAFYLIRWKNITIGGGN